MTPLGEDKGKILRQIGSYSTVGLEMGLSVAVGAIIAITSTNGYIRNHGYLSFFSFLGPSPATAASTVP
jgi:hypothetical protein